MVRYGKRDKRVALCRVVRRGDPEPKIGRFSVADAKTAKLWGKTGSKGEPTPWVTYPDRMLKMRARAFALRDAFADVLKGLGIAEEMRDIEHIAAPPPPAPPRPPAKSLSQPIEQSPMPNGKPKPPRPPAKAKAKEEPEEEVSFGEPDDVPAPGALLSALDFALDTAQSAEEVEGIWDQHDLMATLESLPQGEQFQGVALSIKRRHLQRFA